MKSYAVRTLIRTWIQVIQLNILWHANPPNVGPRIRAVHEIAAQPIDDLGQFAAMEMVTTGIRAQVSAL